MVSIARVPNLHKYNPLHKKAVHAPKAPKPTSPNGKAAASTKDPRIEIKVYRSKTGNYAPAGDYFAIFTVFSHVKPDLAVAAPMQFRNKSERELDFEAGVLCGAMVERLGELYGDNFDVERAARHGSGQLMAVLKEWAKGPKEAA